MTGLLVFVLMWQVHFFFVALAMTAVLGGASAWFDGYVWFAGTIAGVSLLVGVGVAPYCAVRLIRYSVKEAAGWLAVWAAVGSVIGTLTLSIGAVLGELGWEHEMLGLALALLGGFGMPAIAFVLGVGWLRWRVPPGWVPFPEHCCPLCGYDRTGLDADARCPECGALP